jgi:maltodextrin utilization protein YvdJ
MLRFFVRSFTLTGVWDNRNASKRFLPWYFLLLILLVSFPLNYQIVKTGGWALFDFTSKMREEAPSWLPSALPEDLAISNAGLEWFQAQQSAFESLNHAGETLLYVFQPTGIYVGNERALVFYPDRIVYYEEGGTERLSTNYQNISERVAFLDLKMLDRGDAVDQFAGLVEQAFSPYAVMRSVVLNVGINLFLNALLVLAVAVIFLLLRVKFQKVTNFGENLCIVLSAMTLPALIAFFVGVAGVMEVNAFSAVVFQFFSPLIAVVAIFRGAKRAPTH